ncbi:MAG: RIP metalloprotease RseP [Bacteroidota bacterium]
MDPFLVKAIQLLLSLSFLIVLHELGHFIPAKLFGTRVEKFYLFFDVKFSLFKKKIGDTVYGIGWLPLGGYVKIAGMIDESMDKEQMKQPPQPWEFRSKPAWQRLIIMIGGVTVNIVLGFLIYMMILFVWGERYIDKDGLKNGFSVSPTMQELGFENGDVTTKINDKKLTNVLDVNKYLMLRDVESITVERDGQEKTISIPEDIGSTLFQRGEMEAFSPIGRPIIDSVLPENPAAKAGLKKGDLIQSVNGEEINYWHEFVSAVKANKEQEIEIAYYQTAAKNSKDIAASDFSKSDLKTVRVTPSEDGLIGITYLPEYEVASKKFSFAESIPAGFDYGYWTLRDYVAQFKFVFTKKGATQVGGFGAIGNLFPEVWDWRSFWQTTAFISIILAFMNILPIPALDGGHVVFLLYEMVSGRKPNEKVMEYAQMIGFFLLIALVLFANGNDVYRWLFE